MRKKFLLPFVLLIMGSSSVIKAESKKIEFLTMTAGTVLVMQSNGYVISAGFDYTPKYILNNNYYARANIGLDLLLNNADNYFYAIDTEALFGMHLSKVYDLEFGGGAQYWSDSGEIMPALSVNLIYNLSKKIAVIDRFYAAYTLGFATSYGTHGITIGAGVKL
ncbi:MAG: hypothetical protein OEZ13_00045 [Spirochaetia bacterium]|nr:hypothetical protein [Spirochaetia bacterium]